MRLRELRRYRKEQGHCQVPDRYPPNRALGRWARHLRTARKHGTLPEDKVRLLDALGFAWVGSPKHSEIVWERHLEEFKRFRKEHGHLAVPNVYPSNRPLGRWAHYLRQEKRRGGLSAERVRQLDALGFAWVNVRRRDYSAIWLRRIAELKRFREKHGHCCVPRDYSPDGSLGRWADRIRKQNRDGTLSKERVRQLRAIGFCWDPKPAPESLALRPPSPRKWLASSVATGDPWPEHLKSWPFSRHNLCTRALAVGGPSQRPFSMPAAIVRLRRSGGSR